MTEVGDGDRPYVGHAKEAVAHAMRSGADAAEIFVTQAKTINVDLQKNDIHTASVAQETTFGLRVVRGGSIGFSTVNRPKHLLQAAEEALAVTAVAPPDAQNGLRAPLAITPLAIKPDPAIVGLGIEELVDLAADCVKYVRQRDRRVMIDSGTISATVMCRGLVTSTGIELWEEGAVAGGSVFGMAVDGEDVGSFDHDGQVVRSFKALRHELEAACERFVIKTLGALGAEQGESFRGTIVLAPEVVNDFLLSNLMSVLTGRAVRTGKCPLAGKVGEPVAAPTLHLTDDARDTRAALPRAFDREGTPTRPMTILEDGVLRGFLYDVYEGRAAGTQSTGHAQGGASTQPSIGSTHLTLRAGDESFTRLCCDPERAILVSRFSGSCSPITGEFSGVVKGGFLLRSGRRTPIKETLIAGNLYDVLKNVSGVSIETRHLQGSDNVPALRVEDVSVTAG